MEFHSSSASRLEPNSPPPSNSPLPSSSPSWPPFSEVDFEPMFEKVVTPSDVGKLNRLVIPKQHAERFFPLDPTTTTTNTSSSSTSPTVGGLLLSFEERRSGKPWRFRYSYWNSSQSYVMTKGWSRFVKEKHLSAGDTVLFSRSISDTRRLFIDWRRRPAPTPLPDLTPIIGSVVPTWGGGGMLHYFPHPPPPPPPLHPGMYFRSMGPMPQLQVRMVDRGTILESVPVVAHGLSSDPIDGPRRRRGFRLFGVDLDDDHEDGRGRRMNTELQLMPPQAMEEGRR